MVMIFSRAKDDQTVIFDNPNIHSVHTQCQLITFTTQISENKDSHERLHVVTPSVALSRPQDDWGMVMISLRRWMEVVPYRWEREQNSLSPLLALLFLAVVVFLSLVRGMSSE